QLAGSCARFPRTFTWMGARMTSSLHSSATLPISLFEKREELHRVLKSKHFAASPKKSRFLKFVSEQTFVGNGDKLNEYLIGVEVYDRGSEFDSQKDPIVRVQAHEIRRLLRRYYEEEGKESLMRLELPPGAYVPVFARAAIDRTEATERRRVPTGPTARRRVEIHLATAVTLACACLILAGLLIARGWQARKSAQSTPARALPAELDWFWHSLLPPAEAPIIAIPNHPLLRAAHDGDSAQTLARAHNIPKSELPEFRDTIHFRELKQFRFVPSLTDFTSVGETMGVVNLCQMLSQ